MKQQQIRRGVFETNSSSSHSITIGSLSFECKITNYKDKVVVLPGGEFGWGYDTYDDWMSKASYCAIDQEHSESNMQMLKEVIMKITGATDVDFSKCKYENGSYVDHQSSGTAHEAFDSKDILTAFIFNPSSVLTIDNDNH